MPAEISRIRGDFLSTGLAASAVKSPIKKCWIKALKYHVPMCLPESHPMFETDAGVLEE